MVSQGLILIITVSIAWFCPTFTQSTGCGTVSFKKHVRNMTFYRSHLPGLPDTSKLSVRYNITVKREPCCPVISFGVLGTHDDNWRNLVQRCFSQSLSEHVTAVDFYIYLHHGSPTAGCVTHGDYYNCVGTRQFDIGQKGGWYMDVGHLCGIGPTQDVQIEMEFECDFQSKCEAYTHSYCKEAFNYSMTSFPNMLGQTSQKRADYVIDEVKVVIEEILTCYKFSKELICYLLFPRCTGGKRIVPCKKMCEDMQIGCQYFFTLYQTEIDCRMYPDSIDPEVCYYEQVTCPMLENPKNGSVVVNSTDAFDVSEYSCNNGYIMKGDQRRVCTYSGNWNGTEPVCIIPQNVDVKSIIIGTVSGVVIVAVIAIVVGLCVYNRQKISSLLTHKQFRMQRFN